MKLLSIKAHGFKSFADKVEIAVGDGITGVVGPNGSGKSNVVDAVRWVLGETSLKEIRLSDSSDVIFMGSSSRDASTHAWVSLTFDNTDHYLASPFDEVEIKREVYKTGENEYYINNSKVRRKDITDLFIDSGSNPDSFSIISQGKVVEVLKGKSIDRRVIIEEAAGVLKYKKRKEETMHKLESTNDNLEKVSLVINELESNLEPLRAQADIAHKFLNYKEELKSIEIALLAKDIKTINDEYLEKKNKLDDLKQDLLKMDNSNVVDSSKLEKLKNKSLKLDEDINKMSLTLISLSEQVSSLETKKQVIQERQKYEVEDQKLQNNIIVLKNNEISLKKHISLLESEIDTIKLENDKKHDIEDKLNNEYKVNTTKKNTLLSELNRKNIEELTLKNKIDNLTSSLENDSSLPFSVKSVINNPRLDGIHDVLAKLIDTDEKYSVAIETALGANQNVIVVKDEKSATSAINYLKDNKLGRATFFPLNIIKGRYINDNDMKAIKEVPGYIGIASNLVTYNPMYKEIVTNQLGNTIIVDNINSMNLMGKKIEYRYRVITLDGELSHVGGSMTGGAKKQSNGYINTKYEIDNLSKDYDKCINECKLIEESINTIDSDLSVLESQVFEARKNSTRESELLSSRELDLKEVKKKLESVQQEISGTSNLLNKESDKEFNEVMEEYLRVSTERDLTSIDLANLKGEKSDVNASIEELELANKKINSDYNKKQNAIKDLEVEIGKMDIKLDNLLNRLSDEYSITYELAAKEYILDLDEEVARDKVNHLRRDIKDLGDVNVGSIDEFNRFNERYTFLSNQKNDLTGAINDLMQVILELDETMKERFKETFVKVNEEFGKVFKELFKGGSASLVLTDPNDYLNTGVDINACPPGKSLKNINALSGGEMTLTAIALLFSILNIRVVPFVILDEVEAALDENNVDTFGTYLRNYGKSTQFIIITHKKRTMEYANTLYGITMQESGVSKLVSVRLENI
ncbi:MAG TPA: AAA family ATPase [Bacilli bacterium]|nr:AAA family ATPase [Bacilli bacterium]